MIVERTRIPLLPSNPGKYAPTRTPARPCLAPNACIDFEGICSCGKVPQRLPPRLPQAQEERTLRWLVILFCTRREDSFLSATRCRGRGCATRRTGHSVAMYTTASTGCEQLYGAPPAGRASGGCCCKYPSSSPPIADLSGVVCSGRSIGASGRKPRLLRK